MRQCPKVRCVGETARAHVLIGTLCSLGVLSLGATCRVDRREGCSIFNLRRYATEGRAVVGEVSARGLRDAQWTWTLLAFAAILLVLWWLYDQGKYLEQESYDGEL